MTVAPVEVGRPQEDYGEDLVLAKAMGGFAKGVVCGRSVAV
jgi:hypothetical protein